MSYKTSLFCLKSSLLAVFLLLFQPIFAQYDFEGLEQELVNKQKLLGKDAVFLLWKDTLIYKKELGDFNAKTSAPLGSSSRWLTAALVLQFVDEGKLSLDDKVSQWLPEFAKYGKNYITIRHCLSNFSGVTDEGNKKNPFPKKFSSLEEEVNSFAARHIRTNPGTDFWYGDIGPNIAGRVLEILSKKRFDILMKQKLFSIIPMRRSSFTSLDGSSLNPSRGATSTADDYIKFLVMLLNKGKAGGKQVLSEASVEQLKQIMTPPGTIKYSPKLMEGSNYAFGSWVLEESTKTDAEGNKIASALACPSLEGTWPVVDFCRNYAYLLFVKKPFDEEKPGMNTAIKAVIDEQISCQ